MIPSSAFINIDDVNTDLAGNIADQFLSVMSVLISMFQTIAAVCQCVCAAASVCSHQSKLTHACLHKDVV